MSESPWLISHKAILAYLKVRGRGRTELELDRARAELEQLAGELDGKEALELPSGALQYRTSRTTGRLRLILLEQPGEDGRPVLDNVLGSHDDMRPGAPIRSSGGRPRTKPVASGLESETRRRLASALDAAIKADGRSTRELALAAWGDASYASTISKWRDGSSWIGHPVELEQLAAVLGVDIGVFFAQPKS